MTMQFAQLDQITELQPDKRVVAVRLLRADELYLKDHFPHFPVMPGVLMLEAMYQASAWLVRKSEDFAHGMVVLKEARNVKYKDFVQPGQQLEVTAEIIKQDERLTTLKAEGKVGDSVAVSARLILERFDLAEENPIRAPHDARLRKRFREEFEELLPTSVETA